MRSPIPAHDRRPAADLRCAPPPGLALAVRAVAPADVPLLAELLGSLSARTRQLRYFTARPLPPDAAEREAARIAGLRAPAGAALLVTAGERGRERAVAVAELARDPLRPGAAEFALLVRDDSQARGVGRLLACRLLELAGRSGVERLYATVLAENRAMLRLLRGLGAPHRAWHEGGDVQVELAVAPVAA